MVLSSACCGMYEYKTFDSSIVLAQKSIFRQTSNIMRTKSQNLNASSLILNIFAQSIEARCLVENEDVVVAAPTGVAPTTSERSSILLPTRVPLILPVLRYSVLNGCNTQGVVALLGWINWMLNVEYKHATQLDTLVLFAIEWPMN